MTSVTTTSVNAVTAFGRTGHGTLSISSYQARPSMTVRAFVKVAAIVAPLVSVDTWYDDDEPGGPGWVQSEGESTTITTTSVDMKRLLKAKTFNLRFTGLDDEKHLLTFNVRGLAGYLNFLEIKADK